MARWRAAIVGCGKIAGGYDDDPSPDGCQTHAKAFQMHPGVELAAVSDAELARAERFAGRWEAAAFYGDAAGMLAAARPQILSICSPTETHADILELSLESPGLRAVICEKPAGFDPIRLARLIPEFQRAGILLAVNYSRAYAPGIQRWRDAIEGCEEVAVDYGRGVFNYGSHALQWIADWLGDITDIRLHDATGDHEDPAVAATFLAGRTPVALRPSLEDRFDVTFRGPRGTLSFPNFAYDVRWAGETHRTGLETVMRDVVSNVIARLEGRPARIVEGGEALAVLANCAALAKLPQKIS